MKVFFVFVFMAMFLSTTDLSSASTINNTVKKQKELVGFARAERNGGGYEMYLFDNLDTDDRNILLDIGDMDELEKKNKNVYKCTTDSIQKNYKIKIKGIFKKNSDDDYAQYIIDDLSSMTCQKVKKPTQKNQKEFIGFVEDGHNAAGSCWQLVDKKGNIILDYVGAPWDFENNKNTMKCLEDAVEGKYLVKITSEMIKENDGTESVKTDSMTCQKVKK